MSRLKNAKNFSHFCFILKLEYNSEGISSYINIVLMMVELNKNKKHEMSNIRKIFIYE